MNGCKTCWMLWAKRCDGSKGQSQRVPFDAILPKGNTLAPGQSVRIVAYNELCMEDGRKE